MPQIVSALSSLLAGIGLLLTGAGLLTTLLSLRADAEGFGAAAIGLMGSAYFAGFFTGCLVIPGVVRRTGHIRTFAAFAAAAAATVLLQSLRPDPVLWIGLRIMAGFAFSALYMVAESWLNAQATNESRGSILGIYGFVNFGALALGQQFLRIAPPETNGAFTLAALLILFALIPVTLTRADAPAIPPAAQMSLRQLYELSPLGVIGCFLTGVLNGPIWVLAPVYAQRAGLSVGDTASFMTALILGGMLMQWPLGRLSDRLDRRLVILAALAGVGGMSIVVGTGSGLPIGLFLLAASAYGAMSFPINALCVAHVNDVLEGGDRIAVSAALLLVFGAGSVLGPILASPLMGEFGPSGLFIHTGIVAALGAAFTLYRMGARAAPPETSREPFEATTRTTQAAVTLDPRIPEAEADAVCHGEGAQQAL